MRTFFVILALVVMSVPSQVMASGALEWFLQRMCEHNGCQIVEREHELVVIELASMSGQDPEGSPAQVRTVRSFSSESESSTLVMGGQETEGPRGSSEAACERAEYRPSGDDWYPFGPDSCAEGALFSDGEPGSGVDTVVTSSALEGSYTQTSPMGFRAPVRFDSDPSGCVKFTTRGGTIYHEGVGTFNVPGDPANFEGVGKYSFTWAKTWQFGTCSGVGGEG